MWSIGWAKAEIQLPLQGLAMHGYGQPHHRARRQRTPLYARSFSVQQQGQPPLLLCCLDLGYVTGAIREALLLRLRPQMDEAWTPARLMLTCTHTHSGPGGCAHELIYNLVTPGYQEAHVEAIVHAAETSLRAALASAATAELVPAEALIDERVEVAWNRSMNAYRRNPETPAYADEEAHRALDRHMRTLSVWREGELRALIALFGVHATCLGNSLDAYDGDNKGYAAAMTESRLGDEAVAIFAQGSAGDVSPHYHGPGQWRRRLALRDEAAEVAYARRNGAMQAQAALQQAAQYGPALQGDLDAVFAYIDFSAQKIDERLAGQAGACTSPAALGISFIVGTPVDGRGISPWLGRALRPLSRLLRQQRRRQEPDAMKNIDAAQGVKDIFLDAGDRRIMGLGLEQIKNLAWIDPLARSLSTAVRRGEAQQRPFLPSILPLQIVRLGALALICAPGEFTTVAGQRLLQTLRPSLARIGIRELYLCTYCNEYMGYVTTYEEYQEQAYEGGHNVFGQWSLAAFQQNFLVLAEQLARPAEERQCVGG